jgi:hypothetical protein
MLRFLLWEEGPAKDQASPKGQARVGAGSVNLRKNKTINRPARGLEGAIQWRRGKDVAGLNWAKMKPQVEALNARSAQEKCINLTAIEPCEFAPDDLGASPAPGPRGAHGRDTFL